MNFAKSILRIVALFAAIVLFVALQGCCSRCGGPVIVYSDARAGQYQGQLSYSSGINYGYVGNWSSGNRCFGNKWDNHRDGGHHDCH